MRSNLWRSGAATRPAWVASGGSSYLLAVILFLLGVLGLIFADVLSVASVVGFGVLLAVAGFTELFHAFRGWGESGRFRLELFSGLLSMAVGIVLISRQAVGVTSAGLLIGAWLLAAGLFRGVTAIVDRYRYWYWDLGYGILSVLLAFWVVGRLPVAAMRLLGTVVAVELIVRAVTVMSASIDLQHRERSSARTG